MAFAAMGNRFAMGAVHCGMVDAMVRRIHEEFGLPEQGWRWSPQGWPTSQQQSSALNYQAGMRATNPRLPLLPGTHPDGMAWGESGRQLSYRQIFDQQRAFVGQSPNAGYPFATRHRTEFTPPTTWSTADRKDFRSESSGAEPRIWRLD